MSNYTDFIEKTHSDKVVLFEINKGESISDILWEKHSPNVWKMAYSWESDANVSTLNYGVGTWGAGVYGIASDTTLPTSPRTSANVIGSLEVAGTFYQLMFDVESVENQIESFYWDGNLQVLYVNYPDYLRNPDISIVVGKTAGYSNKDIYFNDTYYASRIKSINNLSITRDNLFNGLTKFSGGTVSMFNNDGEFDNFGSLDVYGQSVSIRYGEMGMDYDDYEIIYTGYLEEWKRSGSSFVISIKDERKNLQRNIPTNYYLNGDYPYLDEFGSGSVIQLGYGDIKRAVATCTNLTDLTATTFNFKFVDTSFHTIKSIEQVYIDGIKTDHSNGSIIDGTFDLINTDIENPLFTSGQEVTIDFLGYVNDSDTLITNPLDIIEDLLFIYADITYTPEFFNIPDWYTLKSTLLNPINLYLNTSTSLVEAIGYISQSILSTFYVQGDGRFNMKQVDYTKKILRVITYEEVLEHVEQSPQFSEYITSAKVGYKKNNATGYYTYYTNNDNETALYSKYRRYNEQTFKTLLTTQEGAIEYADKVMQMFGDLYSKYTFITKIQNADLDIQDIISLEWKKDNDDVINTVTGEVIAKTLNLTSNTVTITIKEFESTYVGGIISDIGYGVQGYGTGVYFG